MSNKPIESFRVGNLDFAVWENQGEDLRPFHSFSVKRTYMDGNGQWKESGEIRLLPQQSADLKLGVDKMYEFWRLGLKQRKQQGQGEAQAPSSSPAQSVGQDAGKPGSDPAPLPEGPARTETPEPASVGEQGELSGVRTEGGFREKVGQSRGSRRSR